MSVYLDHAASTPVRAQAREAFLAALDTVANPSSTHRAGQKSRGLLEAARVDVADALGADPIEVIFTSGGTESINLALRGLYRARRREDPLRRRIVVPAGEHHATIDTLDYLVANEDAVIDEIPLTAAGTVDLDAWVDALTRDPETIALATSLLVNNELGTVNDVAALHEAAARSHVPVHIDAVAAFGHVPIDIRGLRGGAGDGVGVVALSISGHKVGAVSGSGALVLNRTAKIDPLIFGGGQERGLRSGTPPVALAVSLGVASRLAVSESDAEALRLGNLRAQLMERLAASIDGVRPTVTGGSLAPHILSIIVPGCTAEALIFLLDREGIAVSAGSACQAGVASVSHVATALGLAPEDASAVIRLSLGHSSSPADVDALVATLPVVAIQARAVRQRS